MDVQSLGSWVAPDFGGLWLNALVDAAARGTIILLIASGVVFTQRRASAAARHMVWGLALGALLALPPLSSTLPAWETDLLPNRLSLVAPASRGPKFMPSVRTVSPDRGFSQPMASGKAGPARSWMVIAFGIWLAGALVALAGLLLGIGRLRWLAHRARPLVEGPWAAAAEHLRAELGLDRPVRLLETGVGKMPMACGILRPAVLLPADAGDWPVPRRDVVLRHEMAHIQRRDCLVQLIAELACVLYWFHPLVWVAARRLRIEREHACDDQVLRSGALASDYANQLLETACSLRLARGTSLTAIAMARRSQLGERLQAVLDESRRRDPVRRQLAVCAPLVTVALLIPLAVVSPTSSEHGRTGVGPGLPPGPHGLSAAAELGGRSQQRGTGIGRVTPESGNAAAEQSESIREQPSPREILERAEAALQREYPQILRVGLPSNRYVWFLADHAGQVVQSGLADVDTAGQHGNWKFNVVLGELRARLGEVPFRLDLIAKNVQFRGGEALKGVNVVWATME